MLTSSAGRTGEMVLELEGNMVSCTERGTESVWMCAESVCVSTGWSLGSLHEAVLFKTLQAALVIQLEIWTGRTTSQTDSLRQVQK